MRKGYERWFLKRYGKRIESALKDEEKVRLIKDVLDHWGIKYANNLDACLIFYSILHATERGFEMDIGKLKRMYKSVHFGKVETRKLTPLLRRLGFDIEKLSADKIEKIAKDFDKMLRDEIREHWDSEAVFAYYKPLPKAIKILEKSDIGRAILWDVKERIKRKYNV